MRTVLRPLAAAALVAAGLVWLPSPAGAAACSSDSGVTVVVDFNDLRGNDLEQACVADQGTAGDLFVAAGHDLENVSGQAFVCRVDDLPSPEDQSCTRTPPSNAYWGLWWSDGTNGAWTYASQGTYQLDVPDGGAVAFSWNGSSGTTKPGVAPPRHQDEPSQQPKPQPSKPPGGSGGGSGGGTAGGTSSPTEAPTSEQAAAGSDRTGRPGGRGGDADRGGDGTDRRDRDRSKQDADEVEPSASAAPSADADADADDTVPTAAEPPSSASDAGLPVWVGPTAVGALLAAAGVAAYLRRRAA